LIAFKTIRARAEKRKGGAEALARLMPPKPDPKALLKLRDDRVLAEMTKRVFSAGFAWSVIESKWPGFEEAFLSFEPARLSSEPDEFWHQLTKDARIVRSGAKIISVRENARFVLDVAKEHGSSSSSRHGRLRTRSDCLTSCPSAAVGSAAPRGRCC
jgi:3-methyladenine DNA glycosylase Tag